MALHEIQNTFGYVPRDVSLQLAKLMNVPLARIYEVITFYNYFKLEPPGNHTISVCMGTACYLKGAPELLTKLKAILGVEEGETTEDGNVHLQSVRCIGACGLAPVSVVDGQTIAKSTEAKSDEILAMIRGEEEA